MRKIEIELYHVDELEYSKMSEIISEYRFQCLKNDWYKPILEMIEKEVGFIIEKIDYDLLSETKKMQFYYKGITTEFFEKIVNKLNISEDNKKVLLNGTFEVKEIFYNWNHIKKQTEFSGSTKANIIFFEQIHKIDELLEQEKSNVCEKYVNDLFKLYMYLLKDSTVINYLNSRNYVFTKDGELWD